MLALAHRAHDNHFAYFRSLHDARILDARAAIQAALLINGGAATAILTFAGSLATKTAPAHVPRLFAWSLACFALGVGFGATAALFAYLANNEYTEATGSAELSYEHPYKRVTPEAFRRERKAVFAHKVATGCGVGALATFVFGCACAAFGLAAIR